MRQAVFCALCAALLATMGCASAAKLLSKGRYDDAIDKTISTLQKNPSDEKYLDILQTAYRLADLNDQETLASLKQGGQPDSWERIVQTYSNMIARNKKVDALPSSVKNTIGFSYQSYSDELAVAKQKAADYYYALATQRLAHGTFLDARTAYGELDKVIQYAGTGYKDVVKLKEKARETGTAYVNYTVDNRSGRAIPQEAVYYLGDIRTDLLNSFWIQYEVGGERTYEYEITLNVEQCGVLLAPTPTIKQNSYTQTVEDGTEYLTDAKGKPVLDSVGNFIKVPKKVTLKCDLVEVIQQKEVQLAGHLNYYDVVNKRNMRSFPLMHKVLATSSTFKIVGDTRALPRNLFQRVNTPPVPLPPDEELIIMACREMNVQVQEAMNSYASSLR